MPGPISYGQFYQALQQHFPGRFPKGPGQTMDDLLADFPELDGILDPATKGSELLVGPPEPKHAQGPVGGVSGLPPPPSYDVLRGTPGRYRDASLPEQAALLGARVVPAIAGGILGGLGGGAGGAMAGEALGEAYEQYTGLGDASGTNIALQGAVGALPVGKVLERVPGVGPLVNKAAQSIGGRIALGVPEGMVQGGLGSEVESRVRFGETPTWEQRGFNTALGGVFGAGGTALLEGVQGVRSMRAQAKLGRDQKIQVDAILGGLEEEVAAGAFTRQRREQVTQTLQPIFGQIQDPLLRQAAAERVENLFLQAHQDDLRALGVSFVQDFQQQAPTLGLYERMQLAQAFTDSLRMAKADQDTIDQTATILAGITTSEPPAMRLGLPPAPASADPNVARFVENAGFAVPEPQVSGAEVRQGPFYGTPREGTPFINRPDSELPIDRTLPPPGPEPPSLAERQFENELTRTLEEPPGPPRLIPRPEEARARRPGAGVLRPEFVAPEPIQPGLKLRGQVKDIARPESPDLGEGAELPLRREGAIENLPRVVKGELTPDQAFMLHWLASDLEQGRPEGEPGGGPGPDLTNVRKEDEGAAWAAYKASHAGYTNPGTDTLFGLQALGAKEDRPQIAQRIRDYLSGKSRKPTKSVQAALEMVRAWGTAYDPAAGAFDWNRSVEPLPPAFDLHGNPLKGGYEPRIPSHMAFPEAAWGEEPRWLVEKYAPQHLAPEERLPKFANEYGQPPPEVQEMFDKMLPGDDDLLEFYDDAVKYGDVEPAGVGWVMHEIERRGLRQFRQPGLETEGPGSPARRNLPREIAERDEGLPALNRSRPESPEYTARVLAAAGPGSPGLSVTTEQRPAHLAVLGDFQRIVYRDPDGNPVAVAKLLQDSNGVWMVEDLAADKTKGLLTGRAVKAVGQKLQELNATTPAGTVTPDAVNLMQRAGLFDEPLPENPTPELEPPEFSLTPETPEAGSVQSSFGFEPPAFGEKPTKATKPSSGPPSLFDERGAVGTGPTKARATRNLVFHGAAFDEIQRHAKAGAGHEVAGLLLGRADGGVTKVVPMKNVAENPRATFHIPAEDFNRVLKQARAEGLEILASYHTQPTGSAEPSKADMRGSVADIPLVILGMDGGDVTAAKVWQPGRNRQWREGSLGVATLRDPSTPPAFQDIKDVARFVRQVPRLRAAPGDTVGLHTWLDKNRERYDGEAWFTEVERLLDQGQARDAWLKVQTVQLLGERAARAGARRLPDPTQSAAAVSLVDSLVRGGAQDPVGTLFALYDGRTVTVPGVGRVVAAPDIPPELRGSDVFVGPGGIIRPGDRKGKLVGKLTDGTMALDITQRILHGVEAEKILDDPTEASATRLFRQVGEQMLLTPGNFKAIKALTASGEMTVEQIAAQYEHAVTTSAKMLAALSVWKRQNAEAIRTVEGISGASGDVEDLVIRGKGGRVIGRLGDLTAQETFEGLVRPARAWDQVMLLNALSRQPEGSFKLLESASRGFMISQFATAVRNLEAAGMRGVSEQLDLVMEGIAHTAAGKPGRAQAAFRRAAERARIPFTLLKDGLWVGPRQAMKDEFGAIYEGVSGTSGELMRLAQEIDPESAHLLGGVAFGEPSPHRKSKWAILNWVASPKVQNFLSVWNRSQEFTVRSGIYAAEMRAALREKGVDPHALQGMSAAKLAELVGGDEALQGLHYTAAHQALNFSFAGDLISKGFGIDPQGKPIGSIPHAVVGILNRFPIFRAGYPFPRFNLSAAPRFLWDHSMIGLFLDPLYARTLQRGRYFLGTQATKFEAVDIPNADRQIAGAQRELGDALLGRMDLQRRLGTYRRLITRAERRVSTLAGGPASLPGVGNDLSSASRTLDTLRAERAALTGRVEALDIAKAAAEKKLRDFRSQRGVLMDRVNEARKADAPRTFEQLLARNIGGGGAMFGAAWLIRSMDGAEGTPWYILKVPKPFGAPDEHIELDFRAFAPFAQFLFVADAMKDVYEYTDWTGVAGDLQSGTATDVLDAIYAHYEGKYTAESLGREIGNAFLSMSQVAGTTLALADTFLNIPTEGVPSPSGVGQNAMRVLGSFLARFTVPFAQLKAVTDLVSDDESKARIIEADETQGVRGASLPAFQALGNLPFLGAMLIPETVNQITGKPLDTYAPLVRALTGITARERTHLQDILTEAGVAPSSIYLRDTGDPFLDRLLGFHYANTLGRALPQVLEDPEWQRLTTPAQRRDFLQQLLPKLKASAIGETLEDTDPEQLQAARETREGRRRKLRMQRLQQLIDQEGLRPADEPTPPEPTSPPESDSVAEPADEPPAFPGSDAAGPPPSPF